MQNVPPDYRLL